LARENARGRKLIGEKKNSGKFTRPSMATSEELDEHQARGARGEGGIFLGKKKKVAISTEEEKVTIRGEATLEVKSKSGVLPPKRRHPPSDSCSNEGQSDEERPKTFRKDEEGEGRVTKKSSQGFRPPSKGRSCQRSRWYPKKGRKRAVHQRGEEKMVVTRGGTGTKSGFPSFEEKAFGESKVGGVQLPRRRRGGERRGKKRPVMEEPFYLL